MINREWSIVILRHLQNILGLQITVSLSRFYKVLYTSHKENSNDSIYLNCFHSINSWKYIWSISIWPVGLAQHKVKLCSLDCEWSESRHGRSVVLVRSDRPTRPTVMVWLIRPGMDLGWPASLQFEQVWPWSLWLWRLCLPGWRGCLRAPSWGPCSLAFQCVASLKWKPDCFPRSTGRYTHLPWPWTHRFSLAG